MMNLFGKPPPDPREMTRKWVNELKHEQRAIDRDISQMDREEAKIKMELKRVAKTGNKQAIATYAKSIVRARNQRARMFEAKARLNSCVMQIKQTEATNKVVGHMERSTSVLKSLQNMMSVPKLAAVAQNLSKEMMKAGVIEEMVNDSLAVLDPEDVDELADEEIDKVVTEITQGVLGKAGEIKNKNLKKDEEVVEDDEQDAAKLEEMKKRLANLNV